MRLASLCLCLITLLPGVAAAQEVRFPPPSLRAGEFRVDLRVRFHFDVRGLDTDPVGKDDFIWRRARVALEGRIYDDLEYEVEPSCATPSIRGGTCTQLPPFRGGGVPRRQVQGALRPGSAHQRLRQQLHLPLADWLAALAWTRIGRWFTGGSVRKGELLRAGWFDSDGDNVRFSEDLEANSSKRRRWTAWSPEPHRALPLGGHAGAGAAYALRVDTTIGDVAAGLFGLAAG